ncbi:MbcA/ParS/Xre antitoxin family protein [Aestuariicella sp. G3-2]|uniref:MbcA/ParS/Xre antitoxin family protein n=1 Tax=Pseudomaricurvus albidus TaxID=2842452 RepID=UPI001C0E12F6|nr:MbcA/ParS/Xre antitoxin family protein [Aestuariicella albida]MBU3070208.1 MbcA/ParS/Xre antitoxin family protein [Aestuariicella albida]
MLKTVIDTDGRVVLSGELLSQAGIQCGDELIAYVANTGVIKLVNLAGIPDTVVRAAKEVFETQDQTFDWLSSPLPALNGESPLSYSRENEQKVLNLIESIKYGEFS